MTTPKSPGSSSEWCRRSTLPPPRPAVDVDIDVEEHFRSYHHGSDSLPMRLATLAMPEAGLIMTSLAGNGGSDSNVFNARGLPALTLGVGYERVHSPQEQMRLDRLMQIYQLAHALVRAAGAAVA